MTPTLLNANELLRELHALGLLSKEWTESTASWSDSDAPGACAARLVEAGLLTWYQAEQVLAGKGRRLVIGPYMLLERLGRGGTAHVYKAEHRLMKRVVALKIAGRVREGDGADAMLRFHREVEAAGRLRHPSIVTAYDAGEERGRRYLAMEYIEGIDLERVVTESGPLTADLACEIVRQTAEALHHAHECGLIHRDIKPANIMLAPPGVTVKLLDLGLAMVTDCASSTEETDEELCGTPDFMAPEWGRDGRPTDVRGDLYSLGCTFYYLLTGQVPYPGGNGTEKLLRHSLDAPIPLRELQPNVPAEIAVIVERLMARDVEDRYATAAAVAANIAAIWDSPSSIPSSEGNREESVRSAKRSAKTRRFSFLALIAVFLGVAAAGGARWLTTLPTPSSPPQSQTSVPSFHIDGRPDGFGTLAAAIVAAHDGEVVTLRGPGPFSMPPLRWHGKALTLRAVEGTRPLLEMQRGDDPWQALFHTDRALTLEGLDLAVARDSPAVRRSYSGSLICCERASLHLTDCRLRSGADSVTIIARNPGEIRLRGCQLDAGRVGLSVEVGQGASCRVCIVDSRVTVSETSGAALSLWAPEVRQPTAVEVELQGNSIQAGRVTALQALPAGLTIKANANRFEFGTTLLSYTGCGDRAACQGSTVWQEADNAYVGPASRLWIDGQPVPR